MLSITYIFIERFLKKILSVSPKLPFYIASNVPVTFVLALNTVGQDGFLKNYKTITKKITVLFGCVSFCHQKIYIFIIDVCKIMDFYTHHGLVIG